MALHLHRAPRTDLLADALGDLLSTPLDDPFATELVLVPARGVERWLSQRLSHRLGTSGERGDGVCAGVEFRFPRSLIAELTGTRDEDPWAPDALAWPLLVGARRVDGRALGGHPGRRTSGTATPATRPSSGAAAATPWRAGWPGCSRRTPPSARSSWSTGPRAGRPTGSATTSRTTSPGSRRSGAR